MLGTANRWIEAARALLTKEVNIPLIDRDDIDMGMELFYAWDLGFDTLRPALENVLSRDPDDVPVRFVVLNACYRLTTLCVTDKEEHVEDRRRAFREHLGEFVRLREVSSCRDLINIRWEIINACAVGDFERALQLTDQLKDLLPEGELSYMRGRLHFLIAFRANWNEDESLRYWDLPIGSARGGPQGDLWRLVSALSLYGAGLRPAPPPSQDDTTHLRAATMHLGTALDALPVVPPSCRLMLARCYASLCEGDNAAKHYQWMIDHHAAFIRSCAEEAGPLWPAVDDLRAPFLVRTYDCLVSAWEEAGEIDRAISATNTWLEACPDCLGTSERMARLQQKRGDFVSAAHWLRREADRNPTLGEDPNVSIVLALGGVAPGTLIDEALNRIPTTHARECAVVERVVRDYWPAFAGLSPRSREHWVTGSYLLYTDVPGAPGLSVHSLANALEGELRTVVFAPFAQHVRGRPEMLASDTVHPSAKALRSYVQGGRLTLGQMFATLGIIQVPSDGLLDRVREWIRARHPRLLAQLKLAETQRVIAWRNNEAHTSGAPLTLDDARKMSWLCRRLLEAVQSD